MAIYLFPLSVGQTLENPREESKEAWDQAEHDSVRLRYCRLHETRNLERVRTPQGRESPYSPHLSPLPCATLSHRCSHKPGKPGVSHGPQKWGKSRYSCIIFVSDLPQRGLLFCCLQDTRRRLSRTWGLWRAPTSTVTGPTFPPPPPFRFIYLST